MCLFAHSLFSQISVELSNQTQSNKNPNRLQTKFDNKKHKNTVLKHPDEIQRIKQQIPTHMLGNPGRASDSAARILGKKLLKNHYPLFTE